MTTFKPSIFKWPWVLAILIVLVSLGCSKYVKKPNVSFSPREGLFSILYTIIAWGAIFGWMKISEKWQKHPVINIISSILLWICFLAFIPLLFWIQDIVNFGRAIYLIILAIGVLFFFIREKVLKK